MVLSKIIKKRKSLSSEQLSYVYALMSPIFKIDESEKKEFKKIREKRVLAVGKKCSKEQLKQIHFLLKVNHFTSTLKKKKIKSELNYCKLIIKRKK